MAWQVIDRNESVIAEGAPAVLSEAVCEKIRSFFPRYETKRAVLLPALHIVQEALGYVPWKAMAEIAELLEIKPSDVFDVVSFYTHFWTKPRGRKVVTVCRSLSCQLLGADDVLEAAKSRLGIGEHETTADGAYSLATEECLAGCDYAPCLLINEKLHKCVKPAEVPALLGDANNDVLETARSDLFDAPPEPESGDDGADSTSDVAEMQAAD